MYLIKSYTMDMCISLLGIKNIHSIKLLKVVY